MTEDELIGNLCRVILVPGYFASESIECEKCSVGPVFPEEIGELVDVDFNVPDMTTTASELRNKLSLVLGDFLEGVGKVVIRHTPKGIKVIRAD